MLIKMHACKVGGLKEVYKELGWTDQNMKCLMKTFLVSSGGSCFLRLGPHPGDTLKIAPYWALIQSLLLINKVGQELDFCVVGPQFINVLCFSTVVTFLPLVQVSQWSWESDLDVPSYCHLAASPADVDMASWQGYYASTLPVPLNDLLFDHPWEICFSSLRNLISDLS